MSGKMKRRILVYPCGTEIGLEIHRAISGDKQYELYGGSSTYDHGRFIYKNHIDGLPFIKDDSSADEVRDFNRCIEEYGIDMIYPAMDGVLTVFSKFRGELSPVVAAPEYGTCEVTRSKKKTYETLRGIVKIPEVFDCPEDVTDFPVFVKPDVGQGAVGTKKIRDRRELDDLIGNAERDLLICEYLSGDECTVDCFTNSHGRLVFCSPRKRKRIKDGISVNAYRVDIPELHEMAERINSAVRQCGGWFFQVRQDRDGEYTLLEVASRIAGSSVYARFLGANLPLLTVNEYFGQVTDGVIINDAHIELDRALYNVCRSDIEFSTVYVDYDDTVIVDGKINTQVISFIFECINDGKAVVLLTRHKGDLYGDLKKYRIAELFSRIVWLQDEKAEKADHIEDLNSIFIDDSYGERKKVREVLGIPVFDVHNIECIKKGRD